MTNVIEMVVAALAVLGIMAQNHHVIALQRKIESKDSLASAVIMADSLLEAARIKAQALLEHPVAASLVLAEAVEAAAKLKAEALAKVK